MPRKKKLPEIDNGKEKKDENKKIVKRFHYYDTDGKRKGKTLTAYSDGEMAIKIVEWNNSIAKIKGSSMTVLEAVEKYIQSKEEVISPATVRGYESVKRSHIKGDPIGAIQIKDLQITDIQKWINDAYAGGMSPKTIKNHFGLLEPSIKLQIPSYDFSRLTFPQMVKYKAHTPSDKEVQDLIVYARKKENKDLYISILLAAFGPLRRSEACALTDKDIHGNVITIDKDVVKDQHGAWIVKTTKTTESARDIEFPSFVIDEIKDIEGPLIKCNPDQLHHRFRRAIKYSGSPHFRYHDLRHYGASIMHALNVPDAYIRQRGGWKSDHVMKRIYIEAMAEEMKKQAKKINRKAAKIGVKSGVEKAVSKL